MFDKIDNLYGPSDELLPSLDNEDTLDLLEGGAIEMAKQAHESATKSAYYIYLILQHKLWRHRRDEFGEFLYLKQEDYLPELQMKVNLGRASIFSYFRAMKLAINGLELEPDKLESYGGIKALVAVEREVSSNGKISPKSGRIVDYNVDTGGLEPKDYIRGVLERLSPANTNDMTPAMVRDQIQKSLSQNANIWFTVEPNGDEGYEIRWHREEVIEYMTHHENNLLGHSDVPVDVMSELCRRLRTKNPNHQESSYQDESASNNGHEPVF